MEVDNTLGHDLNDMHGADTALDTLVSEPRRPSLLDVLMPATPPQPKNARVVRLFDYEAAKNDGPQPAEPAVMEARPAQTPAPEKAEPKSREAAKAARNQSLLAAAGFLR